MKIKQSLLCFVSCFLILVPGIILGQDYEEFESIFFFSRQPSTKAEAMGKSYVAFDGDLSSALYNPAGISTINGLELYGSHSGFFLFVPTPERTIANFSFYSAGYSINKYLQLSVSQFHFDYGNITIQGLSKSPYTAKQTLTIASQPIKNLFFGVNVNRFTFLGYPSAVAIFDLGVIKKINIVTQKTNSHDINIGSSIFNFNYAEAKGSIDGSIFSTPLPVIFRGGAKYEFTLNKHLLIDTLKTIVFAISSEYQDILNSDYRSAIRAGGELRLLEILSLRAGFFKENINNYGSEYNKKELNAFTYGLGIQIPLDKLTKIPLVFNIDYANLPQESYAALNTSNYNFNNYSARINYKF